MKLDGFYVRKRTDGHTRQAIPFYGKFFGRR
jgi:hypothetical protein